VLLILSNLASAAIVDLRWLEHVLDACSLAGTCRLGLYLNLPLECTSYSHRDPPAEGGTGRLNANHYLNNGMGQLNNGMGQLNNGMAGMNLGNFALGNFGNEGYLSDASEINRGRSPRGRRGSSKPPEDPTDLALLRDIPNWLRTLRLHKYTDNLKDMNWQDLVALDDDGLTAKGVAAKGARTKLLKVCHTCTNAAEAY
jgi:X-X-X-Leu-X-X-Gly heptad repeat protein